MKKNKLYSFLTLLGIYDIYVENIKDGHITHTYVGKNISSIEEIFAFFSDTADVIDFISWNTTQQGYCFWSDIEDLWLKYLQVNYDYRW